VAAKAAAAAGGAGGRVPPPDFKWSPKAATPYRRGGAAPPAPASGPAPGTRETVTGEVTIITFQSEARPSRSARVRWDTREGTAQPWP
jgi:hypothetical protein